MGKCVHGYHQELNSTPERLGILLLYFLIPNLLKMANRKKPRTEYEILKSWVAKIILNKWVKYKFKLFLTLIYEINLNKLI